MSNPDTSALDTFQAWLEGLITPLVPAGCTVLSRNKGNVENDVANALSVLGLSVVIEQPLPVEWSETVLFGIERAETEIVILENVALNSTGVTAKGLLLSIAYALHTARVMPVPRVLLQPVRDDSPADAPVQRLVLTISNSIKV